MEEKPKAGFPLGWTIGIGGGVVGVVAIATIFVAGGTGHGALSSRQVQQVAAAEPAFATAHQQPNRTRVRTEQRAVASANTAETASPVPSGKPSATPRPTPSPKTSPSPKPSDAADAKHKAQLAERARLAALAAKGGGGSRAGSSVDFNAYFKKNGAAAEQPAEAATTAPAPPAPATASPQAVALAPQPTHAPAVQATAVYAPQVVVDAKFLSEVHPDFPEIARQQGAHGTAVVLVTIGPNGAVASAHISQSSGYKMLDQAAITAARGSTFVPPKIDGKPATETYRVVYDFTP